MKILQSLNFCEIRQNVYANIIGMVTLGIRAKACNRIQLPISITQILFMQMYDEVTGEIYYE